MLIGECLLLFLWDAPSSRTLIFHPLITAMKSETWTIFGPIEQAYRSIRPIAAYWFHTVFLRFCVIVPLVQILPLRQGNVTLLMGCQYECTFFHKHHVTRRCFGPRLIWKCTPHTSFWPPIRLAAPAWSRSSLRLEKYNYSNLTLSHVLQTPFRVSWCSLILCFPSMRLSLFFLLRSRPDGGRPVEWDVW